MNHITQEGGLSFKIMTILYQYNDLSYAPDTFWA